VAPRHLRDGGLARRATVAPADERVPARRPPHGEPHEAGDRGGGREPRLDLRLVLTPSEDDAADAGTTGAPCRVDHGGAVLRAIETLDLPHVGLDAGVLELADGVDHVTWPPGPIVRALVSVELFELRLLRRDEQLEHELPRRPVEILGQVAQATRLATVHLRVALRVVAHEDLAEGRRELLDVTRERVAVLEVELVLAALLRRRGGEKATLPRVSEDRGAELLVDEDAG